MHVQVNQMILSSKHRILNWNPGGLRLSTLLHAPVGHGSSPHFGLRHFLDNIEWICGIISLWDKMYPFSTSDTSLIIVNQPRDLSGSV